MIPLTRPTLPKFSNVAPKIKEVFQTGMLSNAKYVEKFEKIFAQKLGVKHCVALGNGTSALLGCLTCMGVTDGEVILPSFTYSSDGHVILWRGLTPVFADINPYTLTLDPTDAKRKITKKTRLIMPTHAFGNPCDIDAIQRIARDHSLKVLYDAAHVFGATYRGKSVAQFGDASVYSLTPTKVLPIGEGGMVATNNSALAHKLRLYRLNGDSAANPSEEFLGLSSRMSEIHAIIGIEGIKVFPVSIKRRLELVELYKKELRDVQGIRYQQELQNAHSVVKDFVIIIESGLFGASRDILLKTLISKNIFTKVYFDPPLHRKKIYLPYRNDMLTNTDYISAHIMDLPLYSHMPTKEVKEVCRVIKQVHKDAKK